MPIKGAFEYMCVAGEPVGSYSEKKNISVKFHILIEQAQPPRNPLVMAHLVIGTGKRDFKVGKCASGLLWRLGGVVSQPRLAT